MVAPLDKSDFETQLAFEKKKAALELAAKSVEFLLQENKTNNTFTIGQNNWAQGYEAQVDQVYQIYLKRL